MTRRAWFAFAAASVIWGVPYLFIKIAAMLDTPSHAPSAVAVPLGVLLLGERPGAGAVAGLLLILAGGWLSTDGRLPPGVASLITRRRSTGHNRTLDAAHESRAAS
jgi:hypothetical protein